MLLVWPDLLEAVAVFTRCLMQTGGMAAVPMGIPALEIHAALQLTGVRRRDWPQVSADVSAMGRLAAEAIQKRTAGK